jgi:hypothetical protein
VNGKTFLHKNTAKKTRETEQIKWKKAQQSELTLTWT